MKDLEKDKFDSAWKEAMTPAEAEPGEGVWSSIEYRLVQAENATMHSKLSWYRWSLAASLLLFAIAGGTLVYLSQNDQNQLAASSPKPAPSYTAQDQSSMVTDGVVANKHNDGTQGFKLSTKLPQQASHAVVDPLYPEPLVYPVDRSQSGVGLIDHQVAMGPLVALGLPDVSLAVQGSMRTVGLPVPDPEVLRKWRQPRYDERLWAGVNMGGGAFNTQGTASASSMATVADVIKSGNYTGSPAGMSNGYVPTSGTGYAWSFSMAAGRRVSYHWVLMGGVGYLYQQAGYASNLVLTGTQPTALSVSYLAQMSDKSLSITTPYLASSSLEYVTLPVQAGYLFPLRNFAVQINAGASTDFFIRNRVVDTSGQFASLTEGAGSNSPYRSVGLTGLIGTEFSYRFGKHYRLSFLPGMRYALTNPHKSGAVDTNPLRWDVGLRFRYILQ
ncbi:MAG: hypothetical protein U0V64_06205 [Cyclobacteriaceae bacterium]